jgi:hypothetical protein
VSIITNDGRNIVGILRGFDVTTNLILESCHERVYSTTARTLLLLLAARWPLTLPRIACRAAWSRCRWGCTW